MEAAHRKYLIVETAVSVVINAVISALFVVLSFGGRSEVELWGSDGLAPDMLVQTFAVALFSVLVPTALTRRRLRSGKISGADGRSASLPRNLFVRALLIAAAATVVLAGITIALLAAAWTGPMAYGDLFLFKVVYGGLVALLVTPVAVAAALRDRAAVPADGPVGRA